MDSPEIYEVTQLRAQLAATTADRDALEARLREVCSAYEVLLLKETR